MSAGTAEAALVRRMREAQLLTDAGHLSMRQIAVLAQAAAPDERLRTVAAISGGMDTSKPSVCRAVDALAEKGLVKRRYNRKDLRVVFVDLTADGRQRLAKVMSALQVPA